MLSAIDLNPPDDLDAYIADFWEQLPSLEKSEGGLSHSEDEMKERDLSRYLELKEFTSSLVRGVAKEQKDIDAAIVPYLDHWDLYRLGTVERTVLRMGVYELKVCKTPVEIAINEAVDLVNWFSQPSSRTIVNGILDRYAKSL